MTDLIAVEAVRAGGKTEGANRTFQGEINQSRRIDVLRVNKALFDDVVTSAVAGSQICVKLLSGEASRVGARTAGLVVILTGKRAVRNEECAGGDVENESARVARVGGALTAGCIKTGSAETVGNACALTLACSLGVCLECGAGRGVKGAGGGVVGEAAGVGWERVALADSRVEGGSTGTLQDSRTLTLTSGLRVCL